MNAKEIGEIRRHIAPGRCAVGKVYGCYVNSAKNVIAYPEASFGLMSNEEAETYFDLLKKPLTGTPGKNLRELSFPSSEVMEGDAHGLLVSLLRTNLEDGKLREEFFSRVIETLEPDGYNVLILLAADAYDVPYRAKDDEVLPDSSETVYRYLLSAVCPVKSGKPVLGYDSDEGVFRSRTVNQLVEDPALGFLFPAFDDRAPNLYGALFYTRDPARKHEAFVNRIFHLDAGMSAPEQKETFSGVLADALGEDCSFEVVQKLHEDVREKLLLHKESKLPDSLALFPDDVGDILRESGVPEEKVALFRERCAESFGADAPLDPTTVMESRKFEVLTPMVKITVDPEFSSRIEARLYEGRKYLLIPADEGVEINGVACRIDAGEE